MSYRELAEAIVRMLNTDAEANARVRASNEPFRAMIDIARQRKMHNLTDGSRRYHLLVDALEEIL